MMRRNGSSISVTWPLAIAVFLSCSGLVSRAPAQDKPQVEKPAGATRQPSNDQPALPDIEIRARVRARELRFEQVGNAGVEFTGKPKRKTTSDFDRGNLPDPVQPGVTYRDIDVRLVITTTFAELGRAVSEILGLPSRQASSQLEDEARQRRESAASQLPPISPRKAVKPGGRRRR